MRHDKPLLVSMTVAVLGLVAAGWLLTLDIYVAERTTDGNPAACGSAYDVVLFKHGFGRKGETPPNVAEIDKACLAEGRRDVVLGTLAGVVGLAAAVYAAMRADRTLSRRQAGDLSSSRPSSGA